MSDMVETIRESSAIQEKTSDEQVKTLFEDELKTDEMFLTFQREQGEANRGHEMMLMKLMMSGWNSGNAYGPAPLDQHPTLPPPSAKEASPDLYGPQCSSSQVAFSSPYYPDYQKL